MVYFDYYMIKILKMKFKKKIFAKDIFLISFIVMIILLNINIILAVDLDLKIIGEINNITSDVHLRIDSNAVNGLGVYDMFSQSSPSEYSTFYSNISGSSLSIDSWTSNPRTVDLIYTMASAQTGTLTLLWDALSSTDYEATLTDYGNDSSYTTIVGSEDMRASSSYATELTGDSNIYVRVVVDDYTASAAPAADTGGDTGGGGGGDAVAVVSKGLFIKNKELNVDTVINTVKTRKIELHNRGTTSLTINPAVSRLADILDIVNKGFVLAPGEKEFLEVRIIAPEDPGIYTGKISIYGESILVSVNVNTKELLFDAGIVVPEDYKIIRPGIKLPAQVTLIPMGEDPRLDVTLNYIIKDFEGRTFLTESETILVEGQKTFRKEFSTKNLPEGSYVLGLELIYPNYVATSSSHFEVAEKKGFSFFSNYSIILIALGIGIFLLILMIILVIKGIPRMGKRKSKKR